MDALQLSLLIAVGSCLAGFLGSLTGLGGGTVIVPMLTILFGVDIRYAIGAALVSVIATSSGAAAAFVKEGYSNVRVGMLLEVGTTLGAVSGAFLAAKIPTQGLSIVFGVVLLISAALSFRSHENSPQGEKQDGWARWFRLDSTYPTPAGVVHYHVQHVPLGLMLMYFAGGLSGLLGIGSGAFKVLAMDQAMKLPFKVSTTTSNFMIGVTAAASAGIYLRRGYMDPAMAMPVTLGVLVGAILGAKVLMKASPKRLRIVFAFVIVLMAVEMIREGMIG